MSTLVQTFLRSGGSLDDLVARYAITARRHREHPQLVLLKYNQIASPLGEPIVRECRGIILDESDDWRIVSRAFDKFFNHGEGHAAAIDWSTACVQEKLDGSLIVTYAYRGAWHIATSGTPDASGSVHGADEDFGAYARRVMGDVLPSPDCGICFYFELTGPLNRVVVVHAESRITLLGARDLRTGEEMSAWGARAHLDGHVPVVRQFALTSFEEIAASFASISPLSQEGYVVLDDAFNRVKVKHPGYVALHHAKDGMGPRAFVEIARSGETSEVIAAFPEFEPLLAAAKARVESTVAEIEADFARLRRIEGQKDFAIAAQRTRCPAALFMLRAGKTSSARAFLRDMQINRAMDLLGVNGGAS